MNATITAPAIVSDSTVELPRIAASARTTELDRTTEPARTTEPVETSDAPEAAASASTPAGAGAAEAGPAPAAPLGTNHANAFSVASFVLGIVSIVAGWSFFAPVTGLVLGILALRRGTGERTLALWGVWLNGVLLALTALAALAVAALFAIGIIAAPVLAS